MSPSNKIKLSIDAGGRLIHIALIDGQFNMVAEGTGMLEQDIDPGIYKIRYSAGDRWHDELKVLEKNTHLYASDIPELVSKTSPIPLHEAVGVPQYQEDLCRQIREQHKGHSGLQLFIRSDQAYLDEIGQRITFTITDITLQNPIHLDGFIDPATNRFEHDNDSWACGGFVELPEGQYLIHYELKEKHLDQVFVVRQGFVTQLFLLHDEDRGLDLISTSIIMALDGKPFEPNDYETDYEACEMARQGLAYDQALVSDHNVQAMAYRKGANPMLGLYSAHLMIMNPKLQDKLNFLKIVFDNMYGLLGNQTDVMAIGLWLKHQGVESVLDRLKGYQFMYPPMLHHSWQLIQRYSMYDPELLPSHSLLARVAGNEFDHGAYFIWEPNEDIDAFAHGSPEQTEFANYDLQKDEADLLPQLFAQMVQAESIADMAKTNNFNHVEMMVLSYLDEILPVDFVEQLAEFIDHYDNNRAVQRKRELHIARLLRYMTPETIKVVKRSLQYLDPDKRARLERVIQKFGSGKEALFHYFEKALEDMVQSSNMNRFEMFSNAPTPPDEMTKSLPNRGISSRSLEDEEEPTDMLKQNLTARSFMEHTGLPKSSVNIALQGIMKKMKHSQSDPDASIA